MGELSMKSHVELNKDTRLRTFDTTGHTASSEDAQEPDEWADILNLVPAQAVHILDLGTGIHERAAVLKSRQACEITGVVQVQEWSGSPSDVIDRLVIGELEPLVRSMAGGPFDCIILCDVMERVLEPEHFIAALKQRLAPGGTFLIGVHNVRHWSMVKALIEGDWQYEKTGLLHPGRIRLYTRRSMERIMDRAGLRYSLVGTLNMEKDRMPPALVRAFKQEGLDTSSLEYESSVFRFLYRAEPTDSPVFSYSDAVYRDARENRESAPLNDAGKPDSMEEKIMKGERLYAESRYEEAEQVFLDVLAENPRSVEVKNNLACLYWQTDRQAEALRELAGAMELDPDHRDVIWNLGQFLMEWGRPEETEVIYRSYLERNPDQHEFLDALHQMKSDDSMEQPTPPSVQDLIEQGERLFQENKIEQAIQAFEEALRRDPELAVGHNNLAAAYYTQGDLQRAMGHLQEALHLDPEDRDTVWNSGQILQEMGYPDQSLELYKDFLSRHPEDEVIREGLTEIEGKQKTM
jgi:tetratricopeptide (TPR) repeat protein